MRQSDDGIKTESGTAIFSPEKHALSRLDGNFGHQQQPRLYNKKAVNSKLQLLYGFQLNIFCSLGNVTRNMLAIGIAESLTRLPQSFFARLHKAAVLDFINYGKKKRSLKTKKLSRFCSLAEMFLNIVYRSLEWLSLYMIESRIISLYRAAFSVM